MARHTAAF